MDMRIYDVGLEPARQTWNGRSTKMEKGPSPNLGKEMWLAFEGKTDESFSVADSSRNESKHRRYMPLEAGHHQLAMGRSRPA
jgi:hypothetical protein